MTRYPKRLPLAGGPMDGKTFEYATKPRMYLKEDGTPLASTRGDMIMSGRSRSDSGCYVYQAPMNGKPAHYAYRESLH